MTMADESCLKGIEDKVAARDMEGLTQTLPALRDDVTADQLLAALNRGIENARKKFKQGEYAIPDFLLSIDAYRRGTAFLKGRFPAANNDQAPRIVIGVVEGDVHDLGKNIVAAVLEASGYQVRDVGRNVPNTVFLEALESFRPHVLALSTMMSTTLENMEKLIEQVRQRYPDTIIFVGGAPFDPELARRIGADGYAENAITLPDETRRVLTVHTTGRIDQK
jgi:methanogenic corrinoid protein MtbC1